MSEIAPGIHRVEAPLGERVVCCFVLVGEDATLVVDTGLAHHPDEVLLPYLERLGAAPDWILISHADFDHNGGMEPLARAHPGARLLCHAADRRQIEDVEALIAERYGEFAARHALAPDPASDAFVRSATRPAPVDLVVTGGEQLRLGATWWVELVATPGHSAGHLSVWDPRSRTAVVADAVLHDALRTTAGAPAFPPTYRDVAPYRATIDRIAALDPALLLTSHFPPMDASAAQRFLAESRAYADRVEALVLDHVRSSPEGATLADVLQAVGPELGDWPAEARDMAAFPVTGHLEDLVAAGRLVERHASPPVYTAVGDAS